MGKLTSPLENMTATPEWNLFLLTGDYESENLTCPLFFQYTVWVASMLGNSPEETLETALFLVHQRDAWNSSVRQVRGFPLFISAVVFNERRNCMLWGCLTLKLLLCCNVSSLPPQIEEKLVLKWFIFPPSLLTLQFPIIHDPEEK